MRGLIRMLVMFAPMIIRQFQRYQRNKQQQGRIGQGGYPGRQQPYGRSPRRQQEEPFVYADPRKNQEMLEREGRSIKKEKTLSEEERNFHLEEEEFMLDESQQSQVYAEQIPDVETDDLLETKDLESPNAEHLSDDMLDLNEPPKERSSKTIEKAKPFRLKDLFYTEE